MENAEPDIVSLDLLIDLLDIYIKFNMAIFKDVSKIAARQNTILKKYSIPLRIIAISNYQLNSFLYNYEIAKVDVKKLVN